MKFSTRDMIGLEGCYLQSMQRIEVITLLVILNGLGMAHCGAQNLVPNPSFEDYTTCPDYWAAMNSVVSWNSCGYSPDYFNACRDSADVGVPFNVAGYQHAAEGNAYCGLVTFDSTSSTTREIICAELDQPLLAGELAYASMKVSPGGFGSGLIGSTPGFTCKGVGMRFSMGPFSWPQPYPNDAVIFLDSVLLDTAGWTVISGSFIPDSNYTHVLIGNFFNDSLSSPGRLDPNGDILGYAFLDQVCVSHQAGICDVGTNVVESVTLKPNVFPNPFLDQITLLFPLPLGETTEVDLFDVTGRLCYSQMLASGSAQTKLNLHQLASGYYTLYIATLSNEYPAVLLLKTSP